MLIGKAAETTSVLVKGSRLAEEGKGDRRARKGGGEKTTVGWMDPVGMRLISVEQAVMLFDKSVLSLFSSSRLGCFEK